MSNERSPREVCSITMGINGLMSGWLLATGGPQFRLGGWLFLVGCPDGFAGGGGFEHDLPGDRGGRLLAQALEQILGGIAGHLDVRGERPAAALQDGVE